MCVVLAIKHPDYAEWCQKIALYYVTLPLAIPSIDTVFGIMKQNSELTDVIFCQNEVSFSMKSKNFSIKCSVVLLTPCYAKAGLFDRNVISSVYASDVAETIRIIWIEFT